MDLIKKEHLKVHVGAENWQEAIHKAGYLLVETGDIEPAYINHMIDSVNTLGPYIVLTPRFALAHSAPCKEVLHTSVSLITLKRPVDFGSDKGPVDVVMALACQDKNSHMEWIQKIAQLLMRKDILAQIEKCTDTEQLYQLINGTSTKGDD